MALADPVRQWLASAGVSVLVSIVTFWGLGGAIHHFFYVRRRARAAEWKLQPNRWLSPALGRHAFALGSVNLLLGSLIGGTFVWYLQRGGWSMVYFDARHLPLWYLPLGGLLGLAAVDAGLYYSHRGLHNKHVFRYIHRWHHRYVAPTVFTTTAMHPVEFLIFMSFLILPAFVVPMHVGAYVFVIGYTYLIGMIDHAGISVKWKLPFHGSNRFHDDHHVCFHCNYGHHTMLWDQLHGTVRRADRRYAEDIFGGRGAPVAGTAEPEPVPQHAQEEPVCLPTPAISPSTIRSRSG